jgi:hypothetical protein
MEGGGLVKLWVALPPAPFRALKCVGCGIGRILMDRGLVFPSQASSEEAWRSDQESLEFYEAPDSAIQILHRYATMMNEAQDWASGAL